MKPVLETSGEREIVQEMVQECGHMTSSIEAVCSEWLYLRRKWKRAQQVHDGLVGWTIGSVKRCAVSLNSCELHGLLVGKEAMLMHDNVMATALSRQARSREARRAAS